MLGISDPAYAFSVNQSVWSFGSALQSELDQAGNKSKSENGKKQARARVLRRWLSTKADTAMTRDPAKEMPEGGRRTG